MKNQSTEDFDIRAWRDRMGWSQTDAAEKLGVTRFQVGRWESGKAPLDQRTVLACLWLEEHADA